MLPPYPLGAHDANPEGKEEPEMRPIELELATRHQADLRKAAAADRAARIARALERCTETANRFFGLRLSLAR